MSEAPDTSPPPQTRKREETLSPDGKWRSFPKVPCLLQYVPSGKYFGRTRVNGKLIRQSLETDVWSTAKLRLTDFLKEHQESRTNIATPLFTEALERYKRELAVATHIKTSSKQYRHWCVRKLELSWPKLWEMRIGEITPDACKDWAVKLHKEIACHYYNNMIGTLRQIIDCGITIHEGNGGESMKNPAADLKRTRIKQKQLQLPEPSQFKQLVENIRKRSGGWGPKVGDLVEFLSYSGTRIKSEAILVRWEDVDWTRERIAIVGDAELGTKNSEPRWIPMLPDMKELLQRMSARFGMIKPTGPILEVSQCRKALRRACEELKIPKITHHDLRHLFATRCIESGVDIPTVSQWLGHKDKGVLAMKTYGHLRNEHSNAMAQRVRF